AWTPTWPPMSSRRSFHSMQATWQAMQSLHLVVSMSLATEPPACGSRMPGGSYVVAERRLMSSDCNAMAGLLCLFHVHQERLELGCLRVAVAHRWRKRVGQVARLGDAGQAPVDRDADVVHGPAVDLERADALG